MADDFGFTEKSFTLLKELAANNNREWFNDHKAEFKAKLEGPFIALLEALSARLSDAPRPLSGGKATMFRMNRDVRFSEDKSPYKTAVAGLLTPSGTKKEMSGLVYVHLDAKGGFTASGYYNLAPKALGPMRDRIIADADGFDDVLGALKGAGRALESEHTLTAMPRGYSEHEGHRHAPMLKLKSFIVQESLPKKAWTSGDVARRVEALARDVTPLLAFFDEA